MAAKQPRKPLVDRLDSIERRLETLETLVRHQQASPVPSPPTPPPQEFSGQSPTPAESAPPAPPIAEPVQVPAPPPTQPKEPLDVERLLKWGGVALIVLAAAFLLSVAIQRGWLTPTVRVVGGLAIGVTLYALGSRARRSRDTFATALQAGGAVITYLMLWAGFQVFELYPFAAAGAGMLIVVGALFLDVFRHADSALGGLATLGGFATPFLISTTGDIAGAGASATPLLSYLAFFTIATVVIHLLVGWRILHIVATVAAMLSVGVAWFGTDALSSPDDRWMHSGLLGLLVVAYWVVPTLLRPMTEAARTARPPATESAAAIDEDLGFPTLLTGFPLLTMFVLGVMLLWDMSSSRGAIVAIVVAIAAGLVAAATRTRDRTITIANAALASLFVTVSLVMAFDGEALMVALAAQAAALWAIHRVEALPTALKLQAHAEAGVGLLMLLSLLTDAAWDGEWGVLVGALVTIGLLIVSAWLLASTERRVYAIGAHLGFLLLILHLLGGSDTGQAAATAIWAAIGVGLLLGGRGADHRGVEMLGLGTLGLVLIRLLQHMSDIDPLVRVFLFLGIGALFLAGGWYVQKSMRSNGNENEDGTLQ